MYRRFVAPATGFRLAMSDVARRFLVGMLLFLAAGAIVGAFYGEVVIGLMIAALLSLIHISEPTRPAPLSRMPSSA